MQSSTIIIKVVIDDDYHMTTMDENMNPRASSYTSTFPSTFLIAFECTH